MRNKYVVSTILLGLLLSSAALVIAQNSDTQNGYYISIWDDTDNFARRSEQDVTFYLNLTNSTDGTIINDSVAACNISFNYDNSWTSPEQMSFGEDLWSYTRQFNYKGTNYFKVECNVSVELEDTFEIENTRVSFIHTGNHTFGYENSLVTFDFSENVIDPDLNDFAIYSIVGINSTNHSFENVSDYYWINIGESTGLLSINATHDNETANRFDIAVFVRDSDNAGESDVFYFTIYRVNDPPYFVDLTNLTAGENEETIYNFTAEDEENNIPFTFNVSFVECKRPFMSPVLDTGNNCTLNVWNWTYGNNWLYFNFTPNGTEIGSYILNLTVTDSGQEVEPYNASSWTLINLTVIEVNDPPLLTYVCDQERNATENFLFSCYINATDEDELFNLTFSSNYSWFLDNVVVPFNITTNDYAIATVNFTPTKLNVGNWSINVTVTDTGNLSHNDIKFDSRIIDFFIININDSCYLNDIPDQDAYLGGLFELVISAEDDDLLIPDKSVFNEEIIFSYENVSGGLNLDINKLPVEGGTNQSNATISFLPTAFDIGNHTIRINISDISGHTDFKEFIIEVHGNAPAEWNTSAIPDYFEGKHDELLEVNLSEYAYDNDSDSIYFEHYLSGDQFPSFSLNNITGIISFTPGKIDVGNHSVNISVTDGKGIFAYHVFNFNITYETESPLIQEIPDFNISEGSLFILYINATDRDLEIPDSIFNESLMFSHNSTIDFNITVAEISGSIARGLINFIPELEEHELEQGFSIHVINVTVTDTLGNFDWTVFTLNISKVNQPPYFLENISNQIVTVGEEFFLEILADDREQGNNSQGNLWFTSNMTAINNSMNHTYGIINVTFGNEHTGFHVVEITVSDGINETSMNFNLTVLYENKNPEISIISFFPSNRSVAENYTLKIYVEVNDFNFGPPNEDKVTVFWFIDDVLRHTNENITEEDILIWDYVPGFDEETTGEPDKVLKIVANDSFGGTNQTTSSIQVTHTNAPPILLRNILNQRGNSGLQLDLHDYFYDEDHVDPRYNQTIHFEIIQYAYVKDWQIINESNYSASSAISTSLNTETYVLTFSSSSHVTSLFKITAIDSLDSSMRVSSNVFEVEIIPSESPAQTISSGGGGGASRTQYISINFITPGPLKMYQNDTLISYIILKNDGDIALQDISLELNGSEHLNYELNETYISKLDKGEKRNLTLTISSFNRKGDEEIIITGIVERPSFSDSAKIHITVLDRDIDTIAEKLAFIEQLIADNPVCLELDETVRLAKEAYLIGDYENALFYADMAIKACRLEISSVILQGRREIPLFKPYLPQEFTFLLLGLLVFLVMIYYIRRVIFKRKNEGKFKNEDDDEIKIEVE